MRYRSVRVVAAVCVMVLLAWGAPAFAQGGATSSRLAGIVVDTSGAVIPGADVVAKNNKTGFQASAVSDSEGRFLIPALDPGTYTVTVSLMGFKTFQAPDVEVVTATPASIRATLEVGNLQETIVVTGAADIVQTQTAAVTTTLTTKQMTALPLPTRNSMDYLTTLVGVDSSGAARNSTVMGLRASATNITIDGVNVQDNYLKSSDGFFARINPRLDAVEEVTVSTANPGAESAGQGAVQVRFTTRSGTNQFQGSGYWYLRRPEWNTNYYFNKIRNLPKDQVKVDTYGFRVGGPISIPKLFDGRDRAFFFFNYEEFRQPGQISRNRTIMSENARQGLFQYNSAAGVQTVNLYALAAQFGQVATPDPTVAKLLSDIRNSTTKTGTLADLTDRNLQRFSFINSSEGIRRYPTTRVDVNVTKNNRIGVSYYYQQYISTPDTLNSVDPAFPGFPNTGGQESGRWSVMGNWRSVFRSNMVHELRMGATGGPVNFSKGITASQFTGDIANQGGFGLNISAFGTTALSNAYVGRNPSLRDAPTYTIENSLNWIKGAHSITTGATWTQVNTELESGNLVPTISFGVDSTDPAVSMFTSSTFPGASSTDISQARALYAVLTGRVTGINASAVLDGATGKYVYTGRATQLGHMRELGIFLADSWRVRQGLTVNAGIRYELQFPFIPGNNYYSMAQGDGFWGVSGPGNLFKPGTMTGSPTKFVEYTKGTQAFNTDLNNFAPSAGFAWTPKPKDGFLGALMGRDGDFVLRGGYSLSYNREGMGTYVNIFSFNPGGSIDATRSSTLGNLLGPGQTMPLLFRNGGLGAPAFPEKPVYPLSGVVTSSVNVFDPNTKVPYTHSFTVGVQRALTRDMAMEIRYVGTRGRNGWVDGGRNWNEVNIKENGFLEEFKRAQQNLQANLAAGRGATFAYTGVPGTSPLPTYLAYFSGLPASQAGNAAAYTSSNFTNSTFVNHLALRNPSVYGAANALGGTTASTATFRGNALTAGLPANFFVMNPDTLGGAFITGADHLESNYDAVQFELRRRMSKGLLIQASYSYGVSKLSNFYTLREGSEMVDSTTNNVRHGFKVNWVYELPFGRGRKWGSNVNGAVDRIIGGWEFSGGGRIQSGSLFNLGNVNVVGMSREEAASLFKVYKTTDAAGLERIYMFPKDVIDNSVMAFNASATSPTGYSSLGVPSGRYFAPANGPGCIQIVSGDCAPRQLYVRGPNFVRFDMSLVKRIQLVGRSNFEFRAEALNVLDSINFTPGTSSGAYVGGTAANYEVTSSFRDTNNTQDPGGRVIQLSFRVTW